MDKFKIIVRKLVLTSEKKELDMYKLLKCSNWNGVEICYNEVMTKILVKDVKHRNPSSV